MSPLLQSESVATPVRRSWIDALKGLVYAPDGPLTREMVLSPSQFGLGRLPQSKQATATTTLVCGFCSTGCGLKIHLQDHQAIGLSPDGDYPVNLGMACPKGWEALAVLDAPDRATTPMLRNSAGQLVATSWDDAMATFVSRFRSIREQHGPESVAFLSTGQLPTEEMALLGSVFKFGMGFVHADANTRQCMATAATAYKQSFGFDSPPFTYADFEASDTLIFVGANPCIAHPIMWERVLRNRQNPRIIVIDPRRTETAMQATWHIPLAPKGDLALLYGVARILLDRDWIDHQFVAQHTAGFEDFGAFLKEQSLEQLASQAGLSLADLERLAEMIHSGQRVSFWWTMGVNQSHEGVRTAQAMINICLMTGNIGKPGTGPNSITGQCNAMGSRIFSNTTSLLGGRDFLNAEHRKDVAQLLSIPEERIPQKNSLAYHEIIEQIEKGTIRGLWIIATNPAHSWIQQSRFHDAVKKLDFLVVQDMYTSTETVQLADLFLPAAGWSEKDGTFINSERRIGLFRKVRKAPGKALSDFAIVKLIAEAWGCGDLFREWSSPEAVFQIMKRLSKNRPCDITGIVDYQFLHENGGMQWPCPEENMPTENERRLFAEGQFFTENRLAKFWYEPSQPNPEPANSDFPFVLLTGRGTVAQWHTNSRTGKSSILRKLYPEHCYVEMNPVDARRIGIWSQDLVRIWSARGELSARAVISHTVAPGQLFLPMHYEAVNQLTASIFDPYSKQPSYKACAVNIEPSEPVMNPPMTHPRSGKFGHE